ncbi:bacteriohemerythrin [Ramlibacter sp.]|uniref:bacteriohemerythrin n=1 Tax=Ramlibacter sp. TaxID=1917967 RepID=UPI002FCCB6CA
MPLLPWSEDLALGLDVMDETHREFIALLARCEASSDEALPAAWNEMVAHTADHFGREDDWMEATGFAAVNCHSGQHRMVLQVLQDGVRMAAEGRLEPVRQMVRELAIWFPQHSATMDAALARHLRSVGYDDATGLVARPEALPPQPITHCGTSDCS